MPISKIKTSGIEDSAITSAKIGVDVIVAEDIANNAITVAELADGAVTSAKISGLTGASTGILQADGDGTISTTVISSDSITEGNSSVEVVDTGTGHVAVTTDGSERTRFDASGNVTVKSSGVTTPTYDHSTLGEGLNFRYWDESGARHADIVAIGNTPAGATQDLRFFTNSGGSPGTASERIRIDSSGNLLVGQTTAAIESGSIVSAKDIEITKTLNSDNGDLGQISWVNNTNAGSGSGTSFVKDVACIKGAMEGTGNNSGGYIVFEVKKDAGSRYESVRFNSAGAIIWGSTSETRDTCEFRNYGNASLDVRRYADTGNCMIFRDDTVVSGSISVSGSSCSYNTSSDYRLKENVVDMTDAITRVKSLAPKRFNWIADDTDAVIDGFLAHEAQSVVPEAVTGTKDAVDADGNPDYQGIDQSKLVPLLTAALKEAITRIETLEAKVVTLEGN